MVCVRGRRPGRAGALERRERDEEIKRRTGQIHPDETYEDYEDRMRERAFQRAAEEWLVEDYEQLEDDEPGDEAEERAAEQAAFRVRLRAMVESDSPTESAAERA